MSARQTAGTVRTRFVDASQPHPFRPEATVDWGYRPHCLDCGGERCAQLHRGQR
jgi:hypothetical protein